MGRFDEANIQPSGVENGEEGEIKDGEDQREPEMQIPGMQQYQQMAMSMANGQLRPPQMNPA